MPVHSNPMEDYARAVAHEKTAWEAVRHRLPDCAAFDQTLWKRWRQAVEDADQAAARAKSLVSTVPPTVPSARKMLPQAIKLPPILTRGTYGRKP